MSQTQSRPGLDILEVLAAWKSILTGSAPMMSIEVTRECPLSCPGCYAYGEMHLGGSVNLRSLSDYRGNELVDGIVRLVRQHRPLHVSLVGGEPLVRHRELSCVLPILSSMKIHTMVVTSAVIPIPLGWMSIPRVRVTISVDGLPEHHDVRRKPATYDRILKNIAGCQVNMHGTITRPMLERPGYIEEKQFVNQTSSKPGLDILLQTLLVLSKFQTHFVLERSSRGRSHLDKPLHSSERRTHIGNVDSIRARPRSGRTASIAQAISEAAGKTRAFLGRSVCRQPVRRSAHFPECPLTILLIWRLESNPASSAAIRIARNAGAQLAADYTGSRIFAWQVS